MLHAMPLVKRGRVCRKNNLFLLLTVFAMQKAKIITKIPSSFFPKKPLVLNWTISNSFLLLVRKNVSLKKNAKIL